MTKLLVTPAEAAEILALSRSTVYELLAAGVIESVHVGRSRRIPRAALDAYVNRLRGLDVGHGAAA
ncbi:helix-turn-helix domain-containing protein [Frankia sp. Mgl5]|uniref:helix-turn-helix domain-containing protein n=1 Tax=Frankiaceae TaxID=74712 RepID=UPI00103DB0A3|nr:MULTISPECIES: helix-turn-helix domain-containing protein [Frankiaceae]MCK9932557.1 helix-turn-helix domain-containing protein [Frankia sp. Mgl5]TCJ33331.1 DNA-binding protein [Parafrankia sp. BMG5.11]